MILEDVFFFNPISPVCSQIVLDWWDCFPQTSSDPYFKNHQCETSPLGGSVAQKYNVLHNIPYTVWITEIMDDMDINEMIDWFYVIKASEEAEIMCDNML